MQPHRLEAGRLLQCSAAFALLLCLIGLSACSPRYNWRIAQSNDAYTATFPARVAKETRPIQIPGLSGSMTMNGAEVDGVTFAVGVAEFAPNADLTLAPLAFATELARNLNAPPPSLRGASFALQGKDGIVPGFTFEVSTPQTMVVAKIVEHDKHIVEVLVAGPVKAFTDKETLQARDTFLQSVTLN